MGLFQIILSALSTGVLLAIPFIIFFIFVGIYTTPFFLYAAFKLDKASYKRLSSQCGILKSVYLTTKFYLQLLCFKKPTLM